MKKLLGSLLACALLGACNDSTTASGLSAAHHDGYFAVVSTNYTGATTISLLGKEGDVVHAEWVGSKTQDANLRIPLADDVVLPSTSYSRRYLTTIERGLGVVTRFDIDAGKVLGQLRTDESVATDKAAFHSNPQDVYYVSETSAWVSRWAGNPDKAAKASELGTDLIEFDPSTMKRKGRRIDLSQYTTVIEEITYDDKFNPIGMQKSPAYARPTALVPAGDFVVVGLVRATDAFNYAPGMVAVVDPKTGKVSDAVELTGASNCGEVKPVLNQKSQVLVACIGAWGDGGAAAGLFKLAVSSTGQATVVSSFLVADHKDAADTNANIVSLGGDLVVAVAAGSLDAKMKVSVPDAVYSVDLATGKQTKLYASQGAYALGVPAYDAESGVLLVPDAGDVSTPLYGVERFIVDKSGSIEKDVFLKVAPTTTLAAREVHAL